VERRTAARPARCAQRGRPVDGAAASGDVTFYHRALEVHRMHLAGTDWPAIADELGYASGKSAAVAVTACLQKAGLEQSLEQRRDALLIELDRLEAVQDALWDKATAGDLKAAAVVVGLIDRRVKLLGLDHEVTASTQPFALVPE
jgi:hypothetical protein